MVITSKTKDIPGIISCEVDIVNKEATFEHDAHFAGVQTINAVLTPLGYTIKDQNNQQDTSTASDDLETSTELQHLKISIPLVSITIVSMVWMLGAEYGRRPDNDVIYTFIHHLLPIFATIMLFVVGRRYIVAVGRYIRHGVTSMDTLVGIGSIVAFLYSFWVSAFEWALEGYLDTERYFYESVIVVIWFIALGKYLEKRVMSKTGQAIKALLNLQAKTARVLIDNQETEVAIEHLNKGDVMIVKPGEKIPVDGVIIWWEAHLDESMITGESLPITKRTGEKVIGATLCVDSTIHVQATALWSDTYLAKIIEIVKQAQSSKPPIQQTVDTIMKRFIPVVLVIAIGAFVVRYWYGSILFPGYGWVRYAVLAFVGVLVIACPCGLGLATPMAIVTGIWHGAKNGILAKNAQGLLDLRKTKVVVFDKTGTITEGKPELVEWRDNAPEHLTLLASLESLSSHPIAQAIIDYAKNNALTLQSVQGFTNLAGAWIQGTINGKQYAVTKPGWLGEQGINYDNKRIDQRTNEGKTPLILSTGKEILAYFAVADMIKASSKQAILDLKNMGITPIMISGDHQNTAQYIADLVGIEKVYAQVLPQDKAALIQSIQWPDTIVTMVGDGINDAPALAQADIGIAMSTGTDVAIESADITLLHGDLSKLVKAIRISKLTQSAIRQNLAWAFGFNIIGIPIAAGVLYPFRGILLEPAIEGAAMALSDLFVVGNSLRLQRKKIV
jgi:Cu+-exporting ATPase